MAHSPQQTGQATPMHATHEQHIEYLHQKVDDLERKLGNQAELIAGILIQLKRLDPPKRGPGRPPKTEQSQPDDRP